MSIVVVRLKESRCPQGVVCISIGTVTPRRYVAVPDGDYLVIMSPVVSQVIDIESLRDRFKCIICVGPSTAEAVGRCITPREYSSYGIARLIKELTPGRVVVLRSGQGNDVLRSLLPEAIEVPVYDISIDREKLKNAVELLESAKVVIVTSAMVVETLAEVIELRRKNVIAIGPVTSRALEKLGVPHVVAPEATIESAVALAYSYFSTSIEV